MSDEEAVYELKLDNPSYPKGERIQIPGLGTFENKNTYTITKTEAEFFRNYHGKNSDVLDDEGNVVGSEVVPGPTLLQASQNMYGVEVSTVEEGTKARSTDKSVTTRDTDTSKSIPNQPQVDLQNEKPQTAGEGTKTKSAEGGAN